MARTKLDPGLRYLTSLRPSDLKSSMVASFASPTATTPALANVMVELERHDDGVLARLREAGFVVRTRVGRVLSGTIPVARILRLEEIDGLRRAEASRPLWPELEFALPEARVDAVHAGSPSRRGAGVIVGIIDHGIDYRHQSFRNGDGSSRILAIWDQGLTPQAGESPPAGFDYGVEYLQAAITTSLASGVPLQHLDRAPFHGTHVSGIAAGNGQPKGSSRVGVAPEADLIVVANTREAGSGLADSADTLDAVRYILEIAESEDKPVVINLSQGDNVGPHDGTSPLELGIAELITGPGRALVKSAGNEGITGRHAHGVLPVGGLHDVEINAPGDDEEVIVDIWYAGASRIALRITPPASATSASFDPPFSNSVALSNGNTAFVDADLGDPVNGDNRTFVVLQAGSQVTVQKGIWTLRLEGDGPWHGWIQRNSTASFRSPFVSNATTISIPGTSTGVITAGSYVSDCSFILTPCGALSPFTSRGPTRDGRQAPTLSAPGHEVTAPQPGDHFVAMKGSSMAAAMVTGAVALMFEIDGTKTASDIRACLEATARLDGDTGPAPGNDWGAGKLDVESASQCS